MAKETINVVDVYEELTAEKLRTEKRFSLHEKFIGLITVLMIASAPADSMIGGLGVFLLSLL